MQRELQGRPLILKKWPIYIGWVAAVRPSAQKIHATIWVNPTNIRGAIIHRLRTGRHFSLACHTGLLRKHSIQSIEAGAY